jgi:hypothetical protein
MSILKTSQQPPVADPVDPAELAAELGRRRGVEATRRADELERTRAEAGHGRARADVAEESRLAELERAEREAEAAANAELAQMYRQFRTAGERTRIRSLMARSGEARALCLERLRSRNLVILIPLLIGFGIWSTTGVQQGAARLMDVDRHSPVWWVLWGLEALLIGLVCWIIVVRARLSTSGGELSATAERTGYGCLTVSIFLNLVAAVPGGDAHTSGWAVPGAMFAHAIGPVGAAVTAHLIGVIDRSISEADPWHEARGEGHDRVKVAVPRLADMDLSLPVRARTAVPAAEVPGPDDGQDDGEAAEERPAMWWPVAVGDRRVLPVMVKPPVGQDTGDAGDAGQDAGAGGRPESERLEYAGPVTEDDEAERSTPWHQEPADVREAVARMLGEQVVRGAEQYLTEHGDGPGALRELPPPARERERPVSDPGEHPDTVPSERRGQRPDERGMEQPQAAHESGSEQSGDRGTEHPPGTANEAANNPADPRARLAAVRRLLDKEPDLSGGQIAARLGLPPSTARRLAKQVRQERQRPGQGETGGER